MNNSKMRSIALALLLALGPAAAGSPGPADDSYLVPPPAATEEPIVVGRPGTEPTPRVEVRDTVVDRPLSYQNVEFGSAPEAVAGLLSRFKLARIDTASQGLAYAGTADFLGTPTALAARFTPTSRKLFSLAFTTALLPGEAWSVNVERYQVRRKLLSEKYGLPAREMESATSAETVWRFVDGELQCMLDSGAVRLVYVHAPGLRLMRDEEAALRQQYESRLKDEL